MSKAKSVCRDWEFVSKGDEISLGMMMIKSVYYHTNFMVYSRRQMNEN
jgi:hypothetical protein